MPPVALGLGAGAQACRDNFNSGIINYMQVGRLKSKLGSIPNSNETHLKNAEASIHETTTNL